MKITTLAFGATLAILAATSTLAEPAGLRLNQLEMPHHDKRTGISIWYPSGGGGDKTTFAQNPVFRGVDAAIWADIAPGEYPVVLFSHGMGGTIRAQAWLAAGLAKRGAIVISVDHPNSTWRDYDMRDGIKHWTRVADLSVALDSLLADPDFASQIDPTRIMAAGFSYGGWTALSMGGATGNHQTNVATCQEYGAKMTACEELLSQKINYQSLDPAVWNQSYRDPRITHVTAIDPGLVWGLAAENTADLVPNTLMIGLGAEGDRLLATNFDASGLAQLLPDARIERINPAFHFTAMPLCTQKAEAILREEKDDPVCTDPEGTDRSAAHAEIIELMAAELGL